MNSAVHRTTPLKPWTGVYFYDAWRVQPVLDAPGSELVLPPQPGGLHGCYCLSQVQHLMFSLSLTASQKKMNAVYKRDSPCPLLRRQMPQWPTKKQVKQSLSTAPPQSRLPCRAQCSRRKTTRAWRTVTVLPPPLQMRVIALAIIRPPPKPAQDELLAAEDEASSTLPPQGIDPQGDSPTSHSSESPIKRRPGSKAVQGELSPKSYGNHLLQHPSNRLVASLNTNNHRSQADQSDCSKARACRTRRHCCH